MSKSKSKGTYYVVTCTNTLAIAICHEGPRADASEARRSQTTTTYLLVTVLVTVTGAINYYNGPDWPDPIAHRREHIVLSTGTREVKPLPL